MHRRDFHRPSTYQKLRAPKRHRAGASKIYGFVLTFFLLLMSNAAIACDDVSNTQTYLSPSGNAEADLISRFCPTDDENNKVYLVKIKYKAIAKKVFQTWDYAPEVVWRSEKELVISVTEQSIIATSEHSFGDITVVYRAELPADYLREIDKVKQTIYSDINSLDPRRLSNILMMDSFLAFKKWADANTEYENFR